MQLHMREKNNRKIPQIKSSYDIFIASVDLYLRILQVGGNYED